MLQMTKTPKCRRFKWSTNLAEFRLPFYLYSSYYIFYAIKNRFQIYRMRKENTRKGTTGEKVSSYKYGFVFDSQYILFDGVFGH